MTFARYAPQKVNCLHVLQLGNTDSSQLNYFAGYLVKFTFSPQVCRGQRLAGLLLVGVSISW